MTGLLIAVSILAVVIVHVLRTVNHAARLSRAPLDGDDVVSAVHVEQSPGESHARKVVLLLGPGSGGGAEELTALGAWYRSTAGASSTVLLVLRSLPELDGAGGVRTDAIVGVLRALGAAIDRTPGRVHVVAHARGAEGALALAAICHYASASSDGERLFGHWFPRALCAAVMDDAPDVSRLTLMPPGRSRFVCSLGCAMDTARRLGSTDSTVASSTVLQLTLCVWLRAAFLGCAAAPTVRLLDQLLGELLQWWAAGDDDEADALLARLGWDAEWATCKRVRWGTAAGALRNCLPRHAAQLYCHRDDDNILVGGDGECLAQRVARFAALQQSRGVPIARCLELGAATKPVASTHIADVAMVQAAAGARFGRWFRQYTAGLHMFLTDATGIGVTCCSTEDFARPEEICDGSSNDDETKKAAETHHGWGLLPQIWSSFLARNVRARRQA